MSAEVDYYDVQAMIRDARSEIRGEIDNAVRDATGSVVRELLAEMRDLREYVAGQIDAMQRVLDARTENLV